MTEMYEALYQIPTNNECRNCPCLLLKKDYKYHCKTFDVSLPNYPFRFAECIRVRPQIIRTGLQLKELLK